ncbi:hypothetical protein OHQ89_02150 [Streptomyces canus]|uniref:hypothetical protein n=1 Tax=Streptomyces canus TaxID=58343 RepID=UPI0030DDF735
MFWIQSGQPFVAGTVGARAIAEFGIDTAGLHGDMTSMSEQNQDEQYPLIGCGHPKDRRFDLLRDADEPRPNGAELVTEKPLERAAPNRVRLLWWGLGGGHVPVTGTTAGVPRVFWAVALC